MSSNGEQTSQATNGTDNSLTEDNVNNVPQEANSSIDRFAQSTQSEDPYFAHAGMGDRSEHNRELARQLEEANKILNK
ncbi:hypothetical protein ASPSYDRAFT_134290 [Aspergillus sydowii CBS 593.65]|uniref:Uncharacterized protein n=1 Tax=Aspergillus sydowii CBS 593.65 TaxID=1036612 RepID=A0A1L9TAG9_9EURO|nr:uncharacterized protein ASPSYDRAFT_134290 [Aspergillus sydowii CBS 593.65]OJJ56381.1 hypothetical protein ASPSYDRAFT_134290 [Aspergillus sydowii CBS 593.65]